MANRLALRLLTALLLLGSTAGVAAANGLPMAAMMSAPWGAIRPAAGTQVSVVREDLRLDLYEDELSARIQARYVLRNQGSGPQQVAIAFAVPAGVETGSVRVLADENPVSVNRLTIPVAVEAGELDVSSAWLDPFTGRAYSPPVMQPSGEGWFTFTVPFAAGQERVLQVSYNQAPSRDYSRFLEASYRFDYLLQPARHWASFGDLRVEVNAPSHLPLRSNLPLQETEPGRHEATFQGLPEGNLSLYVAPFGKTGLLSSLWWQRTGRAWLMTLIVAIGALAGGILRRLRRPVPGAALTVVALVAVFVTTPPHLFEPNPIGVMKTWFAFFPGLLLLSWLLFRLPGRPPAASA